MVELRSVPPGPADDPFGCTHAVEHLRRRFPKATVVAVDRDRLAVLMASLRAPAEAEATANQVWSTLTGPFTVAGDAVDLAVAVGVAVSHPGDRAGDVIRYADHALMDATMLGGDGVVAFEDADRDLLLPAPNQN